MERRSNSSVVNALSEKDIKELVERLLEKGQLKKLSNGLVHCRLATGKYPQVTFKGNIKPLVHQVYWRYKNEFKPIPEGKEISHLTGKASIVWPTEAEDAVVNDSRRYCHNKHPELDFAVKGTCPHTPKCIHVPDE